MNPSESTATEVAIRMLGQQFDGFRASVHEDLSAVRTDVASLGAELRAHTSTIVPRIAVLEHQAAEAKGDLAEAVKAHERDITAVRVEHARDIAELKDTRRWGIGTWIAALAVLVAVATLVYTIVKGA